MLWKCCTQYVSKFGKLSSGHRTGKGQFSFQSQRRAMPKNVQTTIQWHSFHIKVMLKILQARLQQYVNWELSDVQAGFTKGRGTRDQIASICWIIEKARESRKTPTSASLSMLKTLKEMGIPDHLTCLLKTCMQVKKQQIEPDTELRTGLKLGRNIIRLYIVTLLINLYARYINQNARLDESQVGFKIARGNINNLR